MRARFYGKRCPVEISTISFFGEGTSFRTAAITHGSLYAQVFPLNGFRLVGIDLREAPRSAPHVLTPKAWAWRCRRITPLLEPGARSRMRCADPERLNQSPFPVGNHWTATRGHDPHQGNPGTGRPKAPSNTISLRGRLEPGCSIARYLSGRFSAGARRPIAIIACTSNSSGINNSVFARL